MKRFSSVELSCGGIFLAQLSGTLGAVSAVYELWLLMPVGLLVAIVGGSLIAEVRRRADQKEVMP